MIRKPVVAGSFYPAEREELINTLNWAFKNSKKWPFKAEERGPRRITAAISPHAGYTYSGPVAATSYAHIAEDGLPDAFVIIGPNHTGIGGRGSLASYEQWETPLGLVSVDLDLCKELNRSVRGLSFENSAHTMEHSIEVQIPFLQHIFGSDKVRIVPIVLLDHGPRISQELGVVMSEISEEQSLDVVIIASSDMTHYEPDLSARKKDGAVLERIKQMDIEGMYRTILQLDVSMCGPGPVATAIWFSKKRNVSEGTLADYRTSGDMTGDRSAVVGYASVIFKC